MTQCIAQKVKTEILQSAANLTAAAQTASVDLNGIAHQGLRVKLAAAAALAAGVNDMSVQLQHSDDNSTWANVDYAPAKLLSSLAVGQSFALDYEGIKRYIRASYVVTVGSPDVDVSSVAVLVPEQLPAV